MWGKNSGSTRRRFPKILRSKSMVLAKEDKTIVYTILDLADSSTGSPICSTPAARDSKEMTEVKPDLRRFLESIAFDTPTPRIHPGISVAQLENRRVVSGVTRCGSIHDVTRVPQFLRIWKRGQSFCCWECFGCRGHTALRTCGRGHI